MQVVIVPLSGYIPNCLEAVEAMLAASSIGAVWSSTSPDFGVTVSSLAELYTFVCVIFSYCYPGEYVPQVGEFKYVGSTIPLNGD